MPRMEKDARDFKTEQADDVVIPPTGDVEAARETAAKSMNTQEIEHVADMTTFKDKAALMAFYAEKVELMILDSPDPNPENYVFLSINGRGPMENNLPWVPRNTPVSIARMYVEVLARSKPVMIRTKEANDHMGNRTTRVQRYSSMRYPFTVLHDPNPMGRAWLQELMRQR